MDLVMMAIHDGAAAAFMRPFFVMSVGEGVRAFSDLVADPEHPIGRHPDDYTLFRVGTFSQPSGVVTPETPVSLGNGLEFRTKDRIMKLEGTHDA